MNADEQRGLGGVTPRWNGHTATPWAMTAGNLIRVVQPRTGICIAGVHRIGRGRDGPDAERVSIANASFIAHAVNHHDALVDALDRLITAIRWECPAISDGIEIEQRLAILERCATEAHVILRGALG